MSRALGAAVDLAVLASQAISLVAERLAAVGAGVLDAAEQGATQTLYTLLRDRLSRTALGRTVLDQLTEQPGDPARQQVAAAVVAEQAQADPEFAGMLHRSVSFAVEQRSAGPVARHQPVHVAAGQNVTMNRSYVAAGDIDNRRTSVRVGTGGLVFGAIVVVAAAIVAGVLVGNSDDEPDPASIGTDIGDAGVRQTAEAVRDAYADRDTERLCALSSQETQQIREGTEAARPRSECPDLLTQEADQLAPSTFAGGGTMAVERIRNGAVPDGPEDDGLDENEARVVMVNRDPKAACGRWELDLVRENGRWALDLAEFTTRYLDPSDDAGADREHCLPPEEPS